MPTRIPPQPYAIPVPEQPGRFYIPSAGVTVQQDLDVLFSYSFLLDATGIAERSVPEYWESIITKVGARVEAVALQVYQDSQMERGLAGRDSLKFFARARSREKDPNGFEPQGEFSLLHLMLLHPALMQLEERTAIRLRQMDTLRIVGPPTTHVIIAGVEHRPVGDRR